MALSDRAAKTLTVQRIAALLTCCEGPACRDPDMVHGGEWIDLIARAIDDGALQPAEDGERKKVGGLWRDKRLLLKEDVLPWLREKCRVDGADIPPDLLPPDEPLAPRKDQEKPSQLLAIAALVELLIRDGRKNYNQTAILEDIVKMGVPGLSKSNLEKLVAKANKALTEARKER